MTSNNICKTSSFKNSQTFNAQCDCGTEHHQHVLTVEYDPEFDSTSLTLYFKTWTANLNSYRPGFGNWLNYKYQDYKMRLKYLFTGYVELNYEFLFNGDAAVQDYINALQGALDEQRVNRANMLRACSHDISSPLNTGN